LAVVVTVVVGPVYVVVVVGVVIVIGVVVVGLQLFQLGALCKRMQQFKGSRTIYFVGE
jgi:hypothetical protein